MSKEITISRQGFEDEINRSLTDSEWEQIKEDVNDFVEALADEYM